MTSRSTAAAKKLPFHPAYCFAASPTYDAWAKLTAADVYALRRHRDFPEPKLYFHLNHPIRYVRLVGTIIAIDDINPKLAILTLDDGSGRTIEVKLARLPPEISNSVDYPSNTIVDNTNVSTGLGVLQVFVDGEELDMASTVKVKGTITSYRGARQLELRRISVLHSTDQEVQAWAEVAAFRRDILSTPWLLDKIQLDKLAAAKCEAEEMKQEEEKKAQVRAVRKRAKLKEFEQRLKRYEDEMERLRQKEELVMNQGALAGSDVIRWP